jgi:hypothetical protein
MTGILGLFFQLIFANCEVGPPARRERGRGSRRRMPHSTRNDIDAVPSTACFGLRMLSGTPRYLSSQATQILVPRHGFESWLWMLRDICGSSSTLKRQTKRGEAGVQAISHSGGPHTPHAVRLQAAAARPSSRKRYIYRKIIRIATLFL